MPSWVICLLLWMIVLPLRCTSCCHLLFWGGIFLGPPHKWGWSGSDSGWLVMLMYITIINISVYPYWSVWVCSQLRCEAGSALIEGRPIPFYNTFYPMAERCSRRSDQRVLRMSRSIIWTVVCEDVSGAFSEKFYPSQSSPHTWW